MMVRGWLAGSVVAMVVMGQAWSAAAEPARSGVLNAFSAKDFRGRDWSEKDFAGKPAIVIGFWGVDCPLAVAYAPKFQKLANDWGDKVAFVLVDSNRQDSITEMASFVRKQELTVPFLKDLNNTIADQLGAERTPEVFVLDPTGTVRYRGRIDDQHSIGAKSRTSPTRDDLRLAIESVVAGRPVEVRQTAAVGCLIGRVKSPKSDSTVTYTKDIAPILNAHCVECHRTGEIAPFALTEYGDVAGWAAMIGEVTRERRMPPWHADPAHGTFANVNRLSDAELKTVADWVQAGAPEGNPADLPPLPTFTEGWQLPRQPDQVVYMSEKPFDVKAEGEVRYQYFMTDPKLTEDKWVTAAEIIPGNRSVVHHVIVFVAPDGKIADDDRQMLTAFVPGMRIEPLPRGMAKRIPAGSKFIFQLHYTPNGRAQQDRTKIGLLFGKPEEITHEVRTASARTRNLQIPPGAADARFESKPVTAPSNLLLLGLTPHMHLRGKSFRYDVTWPNKQTETLLDVPAYDFNWQTSYRLAEPLPIPSGTTLKAFASYDNSANNPANPDPTKTVGWGDQSWDEMMIGYFDVAVERGDETLQSLSAALRPGGTSREIAERLLKLLDKDQSGSIERGEARERLVKNFDKVDTNSDGKVSTEELATALSKIRPGE